MKAGFNLLTWTLHADDGVLAACAALKDAGFDGVELPLFRGSPEHYRALGARIHDLGLRTTALGILPDAGRDPIASDASVRAAGQAHLRWLVDCAEALGAEVLGGPLYQPLGIFSGAGPTEREAAHMVESQRELAAYARGKLHLSVEPVNRFEGYSLTTIAQAIALADAVASPDYGILLDTHHAHIEEDDTIAAISAAAGRVSHVHLSENHRGIMGQGQIDFPAVLNALAAQGFDGWLVVETFGSHRPDIARAVRAWRPLADDDALAIKAAITTIRNGLAAVKEGT